MLQQDRFVRAGCTARINRPNGRWPGRDREQIVPVNSEADRHDQQRLAKQACRIGSRGGRGFVRVRLEFEFNRHHLTVLHGVVAKRAGMSYGRSQMGDGSWPTMPAYRSAHEPSELAVPTPTRISLATLRQSFDVLLRHLEEVEGPEIDIEVDYFWEISGEQLYDVTRVPSDLTIGQVSESLANLEEIVADPELAISYGLVWLADVTGAVGRSVVK